MTASAPASAIRSSADLIRRYALDAIATAGLAAGTALSWLGSPDLSNIAFALATVPVLLAPVVEITQSLRRGDVGTAPPFPRRNLASIDSPPSARTRLTPCDLL